MISIKKITLFVLLLAVIGSAIFYYHYGTPGNMSKHKRLFETYLKDTYQKDFVISEISFDMFHNAYHANAYQKDKPDLKFYVGEDISTKEISDGYQYELTLIEANDEVEGILIESLPDYSKLNVELISYSNRELEIDIWTNQDLDENTKKLIKTQIENKGYIAKQLHFYSE